MNIDINELVILNKIINQKLKGLSNRLQATGDNSGKDNLLIQEINELIHLHDEQYTNLVKTFLSQ